MRTIRWILGALFFLALAEIMGAQTVRTYWAVPLDSLAIGHYRHTHAAVTGTVAYVVNESDGDIHIKLVSPSGHFVICECIPEFPTPCQGIKAGQVITVRGITRRDPEHLWFELHPVERIN